MEILEASNGFDHLYKFLNARCAFSKVAKGYCAEQK